MASATDIANKALVRIGGESRILSLDDNRMAARTIKAAWDMARQATLRDGYWNFAIRRRDLAASPDIVSYPFSHGFRLPADCLKLVEVLSAAVRDDYQLEGGAILASTPGPLWIRYLVDVTEPAQWDAAFAEALAARLAFQCGNRIAGSAYDQDMGWREYRKLLTDAKMADAQENPPLEQEESEWITARLGGYW
jgi:hypothetical protein